MCLTIAEPTCECPERPVSQRLEWFDPRTGEVFSDGEIQAMCVDYGRDFFEDLRPMSPDRDQRYLRAEIAALARIYALADHAETVGASRDSGGALGAPRPFLETLETTCGSPAAPAASPTDEGGSLAGDASAPAAPAAVRRAPMSRSGAPVEVCSSCGMPMPGEDDGYSAEEAFFYQDEGGREVALDELAAMDEAALREEERESWRGAEGPFQHVPRGTSLDDISEMDGTWAKRKGQQERVQDKLTAECARRRAMGVDYADLNAKGKGLYHVERWAEKMGGCGNSLFFAEHKAPDGSGVLRLKAANFCRGRICPICMWRNSLRRMAFFYHNLPSYLSVLMDCVFIHVVFTVKNPPMCELEDTLKMMHDAFSKINDKKSGKKVVDDGSKISQIRKKFMNAWKGHIKAIEITYGDDKNPHPHYHVTFAMDKRYFNFRNGENKDLYITQEEWQYMWRYYMNLDYNPQVHVKRVKKRRSLEKIMDKWGVHFDMISGLPDDMIGLLDAVVETSKYSVKPSDLEDADASYLYDLSLILSGMRMIDTAGVLKGIFNKPKKDDDEEKSDDKVSNDDLIYIKGEKKGKPGEKKTGYGLLFKWKTGMWLKDVDDQGRNVKMWDPPRYQYDRRVEMPKEGGGGG